MVQHEAAELALSDRSSHLLPRLRAGWNDEACRLCIIPRNACNSAENRGAGLVIAEGGLCGKAAQSVTPGGARSVTVKHGESNIRV